MRHLHSQPIPLVRLHTLTPGTAFRYFRHDRRLSAIYKIAGPIVGDHVLCEPVEPLLPELGDQLRQPFPLKLRVLRVGEA